MKLVVKTTVEKFVKKLAEPTKSRVKNAIVKLSKEPPEGEIKPMSGRNDYRLRVGKYRLLFDIIDDTIFVHDIGLRGDIYK